ncbi:MAG TPA: AraC family transcriptional regulator [Gaiellaceae bacterium]|nr:AraC family transcriptional regulator [Gaiellaceae bacterium]
MIETIPTGSAVEFGVHSPGLYRRHVDRELPFYELIAVQGGVLPIGEEERRFRVGGGEWLLLDPHRRHFGTADLDDDLWFYWVCFSAPAAALAKTGAVARPARVRSLFEQALADQEAGLLTPTGARAFLALIVEELAAVRPAAQEHGCRADVLAARAAEHVAANLADPSLTTAAVARALYCNPDHLGRAFRAAYDETLVQHIHRLRVARARTLFRSADWPVERVARETGFRDVRYFARVFRRHAGVSPGAFRTLYPPAEQD